MPYVPRPATTAQCAHCGTSFEKRHASRKYCSNSCNVQASYARNGRPGDGRATRADLEQMLAEMKQLLQGRSAPAKPAAKAVATKPAPRISKPAAPAPAAKAAATKPKKKKISKPAAPAPAAKAAATKPKKRAATKTTLSTQAASNDALTAQRKEELREKLRVSLQALQKAEKAGEIDAVTAAERRQRYRELASNIASR